MKNNNFIKHLLVILSISALLSGCGGMPKILGEKPIEPNARKNVVVDTGRPIALESERINVRKEDSGFILHVHQINTNI